jgi:hypothetical protein
MTNTIFIYDHSTGEQIERKMTAAEQKERDAEIAAYSAKKAALEAEIQSVRDLKIAAFQKLGLSAEEIEALVPTPKAVDPLP